MSMPSRQLLSTLITSLSNTRWALTRTLRSENPLDLNGELRGTATFTAQPPTTTTDRDWLYCEEGEIPSNVGTGALPPGLRWTKKYIWRQDSDSGRVSVWFVKVAPGPEEADYLFHDFDFDSGSDSQLESESGSAQKDPGEFVAPPVPPAVLTSGNETTVLNARGNHLCINDMYRTAYAFRIEPDTGEVLSWASRHVVRGPKKGQDIVNRYEKEPLIAVIPLVKGPGLDISLDYELLMREGRPTGQADIVITQKMLQSICKQVPSSSG